MTMPGLRVTTSWDDGHALDQRLADLLGRYGLTGTFYIARDYVNHRLSEADIRRLAQTHEIGAHTMTHPLLTEVTPAQAQREIVDSKHWLEDVIGQPIRAFCYPAGAQSAALRQMVQQAGYKMARGTAQYAFAAGTARYDMSTTLQIYPFPLRPLPEMAPYRGIRARLQPLRNIIAHRQTLGLRWRDLRNWPSIARSTLHTAQNNGGVWHLWGHSWEIEKYGQWSQLEQVFEHITTITNVQVVNNSDLYKGSTDD